MSQLFDEETPYNRSACYGVTALGIVHAGLEDVVRLRTTLGPPGGGKYPPSILKPADAQTVVGLAAVIEAIKSAHIEPAGLTDWGIIAAPKFMAKTESADTLYKYEVGGAWKVNPLLLPNLCLHATSGTISQLLQIKGLNFGVGGGTNFISDAFLTACTVLDEQQLPGLWLVISQNDPEPKPDHEGKNTVPVVTHAVALGFQKTPATWHGLRLCFKRSDPADRPWCEEESRAQFTSLFDFLKSGAAQKKYGAWSCDLDWGAQLLLTDEAPTQASRVLEDACSAV